MTVAVLLVRGAVRDDSSARTPIAAAAPRPAAASPAPSKRTTTDAFEARRLFHAIRAGETLGTVADRYETSVVALVELNPGIDPVALQVGQSVRVK